MRMEGSGGLASQQRLPRSERGGLGAAFGSLGDHKAWASIQLIDRIDLMKEKGCCCPRRVSAIGWLMEGSVPGRLHAENLPLPPSRMTRGDRRRPLWQDRPTNHRRPRLSRTPSTHPTMLIRQPWRTRRPPSWPRRATRRRSSTRRRTSNSAASSCTASRPRARPTRRAAST